jgi:ABC-type antimicrobial peptide transport system permease subunit
LKVKSLLALLTAFFVLFLSQFGFSMRSISEHVRESFWGPLDGSVHVTDTGLEAYLTYDAAVTIANDAEVITRLSAVKTYTGFFRNADYVGHGSYKRPQYSGETPNADRKSDYLTGICVKAVTSMEILEEVYSGSLNFVQGSAITDGDTELRKNKIVISEKFAEANDLQIGDPLVLDTLSLYQTEAEAVRFGLTDLYDKDQFAYEYTVGGIYRSHRDNAAAVSVPWELYDNVVYVPITTTEDISVSEGIQQMFRNADAFALKINPVLIPDALYFHLSDIGEVQRLAEEINRIGFSKQIKLTPYVSDISSSPSARLSGIVSGMLLGVIAAGFAVLVLTALLNMKARRREFAVLIAMGKKRISVAFSYCIEFSFLILAAFLLSSVGTAFTVWLCALPISQYLYAAEEAALFQTESADRYLFGGRAESLVSQVKIEFPAFFRDHMMPSVVFTGAVTALLLLLLCGIILLYVKSVHPMHDAGGKE